LKAAIEGVERGEYTGIVAANLKRLTRSRSGVEIWDRVEAVGGHVHCAAEGIDTSTVNGRFIRDIHLAEAVREREEHAERHAARRKATAEAGLWRVRQTPRGYQLAGPAGPDGRIRGQGRRLAKDDQADEVHQAFVDRAAGVATITDLASRLNMTPSGVRALLANRVYLGEIWDTDHVCRDAHEAIIDADTFDAVQKLRGRTRPPRSADKTPALLAGVIRCASCGHRMTRTSSSSKDRPATLTYACPRNHSGRRCPQPAAIACAIVDEHVTRLAIAELDRVRGHAGLGDALQTLREQRAAAEAELDAYLGAISVNDVGEKAFAAGAAKRRQAIDDALVAERRELALQPALVPLLQESAAAHWDQLEGHEKNVLLSALLDVVIVRPAGRGRRVPVDERVCVVRGGSGLRLPDRTRGSAMGIHPIRFEDIARPHVVGVPGP
jgi:DNA invertase Pin-like site-specific DNA recombinase